MRKITLAESKDKPQEWSRLDPPSKGLRHSSKRGTQTLRQTTSGEAGSQPSHRRTLASLTTYLTAILLTRSFSATLVLHRHL
ncbi:hypothetical protein RRG08_043747 [Elysia crispata]|uniref:Uncharacterized protein n=1 Tax=Elysia crispata TaxID=231223 RepID=A0AAE1DJ93_9GAST|nr:hypothetical protein RRG08_043747 [Elysia crispata]